MKKRKILVFQHVPFEPLGTLDPMLKNAGFRIRYVNFARDPHQVPSLDGYAGLIVLGGPMNVDQIDDYPNLATEVTLIRDALDRNMQVLGICLGAQLLAKALGARVKPGARKEIGWYPVSLCDEGREDPILKDLNDSPMLFHWHGDQLTLPEGARWLASSDDCPVQAFAHGACAYGFQFHLEVDQKLIERWLTVPVNVAELATVTDYIHPSRIREDVPRYLPAMQQLADTVFGNWIKRFDLQRKTTLGSR
ncbi:MAG: gamma-glutamyl-gamma-aminobutyrate hydrolase family protein [Pseudomonadota bacterium]